MEGSNKSFWFHRFPYISAQKQSKASFFRAGPPALCWKSNICSSKRPLRQESWATTARELHIQWPRELE
jgi:hypothetical protein